MPLGALAGDTSGRGSADVLLQRMRAACGGAAWDDVKGWREVGRLELSGGRSLGYEAVRDIKTLKNIYVNRIQGRVVAIAGFDGKTPWRVGPNGRVQTSTDAAVVRERRRHAYLSSFGYFFPERFPATFTIEGPRTEQGQTFDVLRVTPKDGASADLWIDRQSRHIRRIVTQDEVAELGDYRTFNGVCAPTRVQQSTGTPTRSVTLLLERVETRPAPAATFLLPSAAPQGQAPSQ